MITDEQLATYGYLVTDEVSTDYPTHRWLVVAVEKFRAYVDAVDQYPDWKQRFHCTQHRLDNHDPPANVTLYDWPFAVEIDVDGLPTGNARCAFCCQQYPKLWNTWRMLAWKTVPSNVFQVASMLLIPTEGGDT